MSKLYVITLLIFTAFAVCRPNVNPTGIYFVSKAINAKNSSEEADAVLKQMYLNESFSISFNGSIANLSDAAHHKLILLHRTNSNEGAWYTPGGVDPLYHDTSTIQMRLRVSSSDTVLFIQDNFFLSAKSISSGKKGGLIICYLTKTKK